MEGSGTDWPVVRQVRLDAGSRKQVLRVEFRLRRRVATTHQVITAAMLKTSAPRAALATIGPIVRFIEVAAVGVCTLDFEPEIS